MPDQIELTPLPKRMTPALSPPSPLSPPRTPVWARTTKNRVHGALAAAWAGPSETADRPPPPLRRAMLAERLPLRLRRRTSYVARAAALAAYVLVWALLWHRVLFPYLAQQPLADGASVVLLTCDEAPAFWRGKNAACGLGAEHCPSLDTLADVVFRCPALCDRGSWLYSLRAVGNELVKYRGYFVGGGAVLLEPELALSAPYRADSFPCGAAVHAGVVSPFWGGCARVSWASGAQARFPGTAGRYGVADSILFDSFFPLLYFFKLLAGAPTLCHDPRLAVLVLNVVLGAPVVYLASGAAFYWVLAVVGFWTIALATDPPVLVEPQDPELLYNLLSLSLERFLPTCFILYVLWEVSVKRTFGDSVDRCDDAPLADAASFDEQTLLAWDTPAFSSVTRVALWYPFFWLGVLNNITFDRLPVDRLTWHDLHEQAGALLTVAIVGLLVVCCVVAQAYYVWLLGRFWRLLLVYIGLFSALFVLSTLPGLTLRIHHYIFALIFIPGCSTKGRTAYAFQAILLGLFLSGVARWGYASIAETNLSLLRGEPLGKIYAPEIKTFHSGLMYWQEPENHDVSPALAEELEEYTHVSLLINDVERYKDVNVGSVNITQVIEDDANLRALVAMAMNAPDRTDDVTLYLRLAKYSKERNRYGDYTRASVLKLPSYEFTVPPPGIT